MTRAVYQFPTRPTQTGWMVHYNGQTSGPHPKWADAELHALELLAHATARHVAHIQQVSRVDSTTNWEPADDTWVSLIRTSNGQLVALGPGEARFDVA